MRESASLLKPGTNSLKLSIRRKTMEWASGFRSAAPLSKLIMGGYQRHQTTGPELHFLFLGLADLRVWLTRKLAKILQRRIANNRNSAPHALPQGVWPMAWSSSSCA